jgi:hypothetical protein
MLLVVLSAATAPLVGQLPPDQPAGVRTNPLETPPTLLAPLVDWTHAQQAHQLIERWVAEAAVPDQPALRIPVTGVFGLRVTLRTAGYTVGTGEAFRTDIEQRVNVTGEPVDLVPLLRQATEQAFEAVRNSLADARLNAAVQGRIDSTRPQRQLQDIAPELLVDLQLGYQLQSVRIPSDAQPAAVFNYFAPGFHGLRIPGGSARSAATAWPGTTLALNVSPRSQLIQLLTDQGYAIVDLAKVGRANGPPLQRFEVIHYVRYAPGRPAVQLVRGNVLLPPFAVGDAQLREMAQRIAGFLHRRFTSSGALLGPYAPTSDRYDPPLADADETALACYALLRHSRYAAPLGPYDSTIRQMQEEARRTVVQLGQELLTARSSPSASQAALVLLSLIDAEPSAWENELRDQLGRLLVSLSDGQGRFRSAADAGAPAVNDATQALITAALAALYEQTRSEEVAQVLREAMDTLWQGEASTPNIAALPWLITAHHRAAKLLVGDDLGRRQALIERERALGDLVEKLCQQQVVEPPLLGPADVVGGFELQTAPPPAPPNPDWRTAQLLQFLAICIREQGIVADHNELGWLVTAGLASRFIHQIMVEEPACYYMPDARQALGGVRLSLWDNRLAIAPAAVSLLALTDLQRTLIDFSAMSEARVDIAAAPVDDAPPR